jgi:hypothetical protein
LKTATPPIQPVKLTLRELWITPSSKRSGRVLLFFSSFCLMKIAAQRGGAT